MPSRLDPYLHFDGDARAALEFYRSVFGGELATSTYGETGVEGDHADKLAHGLLSTPSGFVIMGADLPPGESPRRGGDVALILNGDDDAELRGWHAKLSEGGEVRIALERQMWGDVFGQFTDRYGVTWMVNINQPQSGR